MTPHAVQNQTYLTASAIRLARIARKHFAVEGAGDKVTIGREIRPGDVSDFLTEYVAAIRPKGLSSRNALPTADEAVLRTFLWERPAADAILSDVVRLSLYSDQIVIVDPFSKHVTSGPGRPAPEGPFVKPQNWVQHFVNYAILISELEPWIERGLVLLIPEPVNFVDGVPDFYRLAARAASKGLLPIGERQQAEMLEDMLEAAALTARDRLEVGQLVNAILTELPEQQRNMVADALWAFVLAQPRRYAPKDRRLASLIISGSGQNVFEAAWIADQIGGYVVPRAAHDRRVFRSASRGNTSTDDEDALAAAFAEAPLPMLSNVSLKDALELRSSGRLHRFRDLLRDAWKLSSATGDDLKSAERERRFVDRLHDEYSEVREEWNRIFQDLGVKSAVGLFAGAVGAPVIEGGLIPVAAAATGWLYRSWSGAERALRKRPAALLLELENASSPSPVRRALERIGRRL